MNAEVAEMAQRTQRQRNEKPDVLEAAAFFESFGSAPPGIFPLCALCVPSATSAFT